jgi:hypothetical protein
MFWGFRASKVQTRVSSTSVIENPPASKLTTLPKPARVIVKHGGLAHQSSAPKQQAVPS